MLSEIAESKDYNRVRQDQEMVDGCWCHVLMNESRDWLWLDASRGCCLVRRELRDTSTGALMTRYALAGYHATSEGIWMPTTIHFEQFDTTAPTKEGRCRKIRDTSIQILEVSANDVEDSAFQYTPPSGALELDASNILALPNQSQPGGWDHLDDIVAWLRRYGTAKSVHASAASSCTHASFAILVLTMILGCELWIRLRSRRRRSPQE
jgi:hypothetical protein